MPGIFKGEGDSLFIGVTINDNTIALHGLMAAMVSAETLKTLGTRTLRLMSAILARGCAIDTEIVRECWIASDLHPHVEGNGNAHRLADARDIVRQHLGQDVALYLRDQERYAS